MDYDHALVIGNCTQFMPRDGSNNLPARVRDYELEYSENIVLLRHVMACICIP